MSWTFCDVINSRNYQENRIWRWQTGEWLSVILLVSVGISQETVILFSEKLEKLWREYQLKCIQSVWHLTWCTRQNMSCDNLCLFEMYSEKNPPTICITCFITSKQHIVEAFDITTNKGKECPISWTCYGLLVWDAEGIIMVDTSSKWPDNTRIIFCCTFEAIAWWR